METQKPLLKDEDVCACARYQVNPKVSHLHTVKRIFRYLNGQPKLGLWYLKDSPFDLVAYTDSDYDGASLDRKSTIGGCQFLRCRLISWQCKKHTVVANSITEAEYVAASSCCGQVYCYDQKQSIMNIDLMPKAEGKTMSISESFMAGEIFNWTVTPLFSSMLAQQADMGEGSGQPTDPQHTSTSVQPSNEEPITIPSLSQPKKTRKPRKAKRATKISQSSRHISLVADETVTKERED
ncbi:hypothetical protein Tco_0218316 [Tanacetum coccineum]